MAHKLRCALMLASLLAISGCGPPRTITSLRTAVATDYGNGVYVLGFGSDLPNKLSTFIAQHPDRRITAMYAAIESSYGVTWSVVIVTEQRDTTITAKK